MAKTLGQVAQNHIAQLGTTATLKTITETETFDGETKVSFSSGTTINCIINPISKEKIIESFGEYQGEDHTIITTTQVNPLDRIVHNNITYEVINVKEYQHKTEGIILYKATLRRVIDNG